MGEAEAPALMLTAALPAPPAGVPFTLGDCIPSPALGAGGVVPGAPLSPQPELIAAIHKAATPKTFRPVLPTRRHWYKTPREGLQKNE